MALARQWRQASWQARVVSQITIKGLREKSRDGKGIHLPFQWTLQIVRSVTPRKEDAVIRITASAAKDP